MRDRTCRGAVFYDRDDPNDIKERKVTCREDTGHPLIALCAGCRVIEKLEWEKQRKVLAVGLKAVNEALNNTRFPSTARRPWSDPDPDT